MNFLLLFHIKANYLYLWNCNVLDDSSSFRAIRLCQGFFFGAKWLSMKWNDRGLFLWELRKLNKKFSIEKVKRCNFLNLRCSGNSRKKTLGKKNCFLKCKNRWLQCVFSKGVVFKMAAIPCENIFYSISLIIFPTEVYLRGKKAVIHLVVYPERFLYYFFFNEVRRRILL